MGSPTLHRRSTRRFTLPLWVAGFLAVTGLGLGAALAQQAGPLVGRPATQPSARDNLMAPADPATVVRGGPATGPSAHTKPAPPTPLPLGKRTESKSNGISLQPPEHFDAIVEPGRDVVVSFVDDVAKPEWRLSLIKQTFPTEQRLFGQELPDGRFERGIVENTLYTLVDDPEEKKREAAAIAAGKTPDPPLKIVEFPGAKVLRAGDPTNIGAYDVGVIIFRYTKNGERRLAQHAIIERNNQFFYLLSLNTPGRKDILEDNNIEEKTVDPTEQQAVETFRRVLDSVQLLDLDAVRKDQEDRLFSTRAFYTSLNERMIRNALVPEQWTRIIRNGKDVGYSYSREYMEQKKNPRGLAEGMVQGVIDGVRVGVRTRLMQVDPKTGAVLRKPAVGAPIEDSEAFMFTSADRRIEEWTRLSVWDDGTPKTPSNPWRKVTEVGTSEMTRKAVAAVADDDKLRHIREGDNIDPRQPWVNFRQNYTLTVQLRATAADLDTVKRDLPPFYLPQSLSTIIYRVVPVDAAKKYMFACYVPELRQVAARYLDVGKETDLPPELARWVAASRAVPITDRLGYDGMPTVHYITREGRYVGSVTASTKTVIVPVSEENLKQVWEVDDVKKLFALSPDASRDGIDAMNRTRDGQSNVAPATPPNGNDPARPAPPARPLPIR